MDYRIEILYSVFSHESLTSFCFSTSSFSFHDFITDLENNIANLTTQIKTINQTRLQIAKYFSFLVFFNLGFFRTLYLVCLGVTISDMIFFAFFDFNYYTLADELYDKKKKLAIFKDPTFLVFAQDYYFEMFFNSYTVFLY